MNDDADVAEGLGGRSESEPVEQRPLLVNGTEEAKSYPRSPQNELQNTNNTYNDLVQS